MALGPPCAVMTRRKYQGKAPTQATSPNHPWESHGCRARSCGGYAKPQVAVTRPRGAHIAHCDAPAWNPRARTMHRQLVSLLG